MEESTFNRTGFRFVKIHKPPSSRLNYWNAKGLFPTQGLLSWQFPSSKFWKSHILTHHPFLHPANNLIKNFHFRWVFVCLFIPIMKREHNQLNSLAIQHQTSRKPRYRRMTRWRQLMEGWMSSWQFWVTTSSLQTQQKFLINLNNLKKLCVVFRVIVFLLALDSVYYDSSNLLMWLEGILFEFNLKYNYINTFITNGFH